MTCERISELLRKGEGLTIEFKRCSGKIEHDVFEVSLKAAQVARTGTGKTVGTTEETVATTEETHGTRRKLRRKSLSLRKKELVLRKKLQ